MMAYGMTDIAEKIQDFLVYLKYEKQYSSATLKNYNLDLIKFKNIPFGFRYFYDI